MEEIRRAPVPGFLIALPHLADSNFRHSVVLLVRSDDEGAMGVVINQESSLLLKDLCRDHSIPYSGDDEKLVRCGGPVQPEHGLVLYGREHDDPEGERLVEGLHLSASKNTLARLCNRERGTFQCFAGYAAPTGDDIQNAEPTRQLLRRHVEEGQNRGRRRTLEERAHQV